MAQTGYTPILIYSSSTTTNAPAAGNLTNSTLGSELAINITDGKLFYKDNANAIQVIGWKTVPTTAGGTGLTSYSQGDLLYYNTGTTLTALAKNTTATRYLSNTGTNNNPAWAQVNLANGVTGTLPVGNGGTGLSTLTANRVLYASATDTVGTSANFTYNGTNLTVTGGNVVIGTSGNGIDFSATPGTGTSELLTDYEEGTWTPVISATGGTVTNSIQVGRYVKVGTQVTVSCWLVAYFSAGAGANAVFLSGLPFNAKNVTNLLQGMSIGALDFIDWPADAKQFGGYIAPNQTGFNVVWIRDDLALATVKSNEWDNVNAAIIFTFTYISE